MKKLLYRLCLVGILCASTEYPASAKLGGPGSILNTLVVITRQPTVTLLWTNPVPNFSVTIRQSATLNLPLSNWSVLNTVSNTTSLTAPATAALGFFSASGVSQSAQLAWNYSGAQSPDISFNLYWKPSGAQNWTLATNVPVSNLTTRVIASAASGQFAVATSNSMLHQESSLSSVVQWSNNYGVPLKIQRP